MNMMSTDEQEREHDPALIVADLVLADGWTAVDLSGWNFVYKNLASINRSGDGRWTFKVLRWHYSEWYVKTMGGLRTLVRLIEGDL